MNGKCVEETSKPMPKNIPKSMEKQCWIYARQMMLTLLQKASKSESKGSQHIMKSTQECIKKKMQKHMSNKCRKTYKNPEGPAPKSSLTLLISRYARGFRANGSPVSQSVKPCTSQGCIGKEKVISYLLYTLQ